MKLLNNRFGIIKQINTNSNSIVYEVHDRLEPGKKRTLKIAASEDEFQTALLEKEFTASLLYRHPLLLPLLSFHRLKTIDLRFVDSLRHFFIAPRYTSRLRSEAEDRTKLFNGLYALIRFLHGNHFYHGDLRAENYFYNASGLPVFFDISPLYVNPQMGQKSDRMMAASLLSKGENTSHDIAEADLMTDNALTESDEIIQNEIVRKHLKETPFPGEMFLQKRKLGDLPYAKKGRTLTLYDYRDEENASLWYHAFLSLSQTKGSEVINVPQTDKPLALRIYHQCRFVEKEGFRHNDIHQRVIQCLQDITAFSPVILGIGNRLFLSPEDKRFCEKISACFSEDSLKLIAYGRQPDEEESVMIEPLNEDEVAELLTYFYYLVPENEQPIKEFYSFTKGEPVLLLKAIRESLESGGHYIKDGHGHLRKLGRFLTAGSDVNALPSGFSRDIKEVLSLINAMGGKAPLHLRNILDPKRKKALQCLLDEGVVYQDDKFMAVRMPYYMEVAGRPENKSVIDAVYRYLEETAFDDVQYWYPYIHYALETGKGQKAYDKIIAFYKKLHHRERSLMNRYFFRIFSEFYKKADQLDESRLFDLYFFVIQIDHNNRFDRETLVKKMEKSASTEREKLTALLFKLITDEKSGRRELDILFPYISDYYTDDPEFWGLILKNYILKLNMMGCFDEIDSIYQQYKAYIFSLSPNLQAMIYSEMFSYYLNKVDKSKMIECASLMKNLSEKHQNELSLEAEFQVQNSNAIISLELGHLDEALENHEKALQIAHDMEHYHYVAVIMTNMGVIYFYQGHYQQCLESWEKSMSYRKEAKSHPHLLTLGYNISLVNKIILENEKALRTIQEVMGEAKRESAAKEYARAENHQAELLLSFGDFSAAERLLHNAGIFFEHQTSFCLSKDYYAVKLNYIFQTKGLDSTRAVLKKIKEKYRTPDDHLCIEEMYMNMAMMLFLRHKKGEAVRFLKRVTPEGVQKMDDTEKNTYFLLEYLTGLTDKLKEEYSNTFISYSFSLFVLHKYLEDIKRKNALYYEYCGEFLAIMKKWINGIPYYYRDSFLKFNPEWNFHASFLKERGFDPETFLMSDFRKDYRNIALRYIKRQKKKSIKAYEMASIREGDEIPRSIIYDLLGMTGMTRGAYFEYDMHTGWKQKAAVDSKPRFHISVPMRKDLLNEILFEDNHKKILVDFGQFEPGRFNLTAAMIIPVLDIEKTGRRNERKAEEGISKEKRQSTFHYFSLRGCFYLDTTEVLLYPDETIGMDLGPFRDYINAAFYYDYLKQTALLDSLTSLFKRDHWLNLTRQLIEYAKNNRQKVVVGILDIDHFKNINDRYGHSRGDAVLKDVSKIIKSTVRISDIVGRYGGEEIGISMLIPPDVDIHPIVDRIRTEIEQSALHANYSLTCSIGYTVYPDEAQTLDELIINADEALYYAKETGRNKTVYGKDVPEELQLKKQKIIKDPVRDIEKINTFFNIAGLRLSAESFEAALREIFNTLVSSFQASDMAVVLSRGQEHEIYMTSASTDKVLYKDSIGSIPTGWSKISSLLFQKEKALSIFLKIDSPMYSLQDESQYFSLLGTLLSEKLYRLYHESRKEE